MKGAGSRSAARLLFAAVGVAAVMVAFLRGNYLLGLECGIAYAAVALALLWLLARSRTPAGRISVARAVFLVLFTLPVGYAMAFPTSLNPDVQVFINKQVTDRRARAELVAVFASDAAYHELWVSSVHLKVVNITIRGSLGSRSDLSRLRARIGGECPALGECILHWDVVLRNTGTRIVGLDRDLFSEAERRVASDRGRKAHLDR